MDAVWDADLNDVIPTLISPLCRMCLNRRFSQWPACLLLCTCDHRPVGKEALGDELAQEPACGVDETRMSLEIPSKAAVMATWEKSS